MVPNRNLGKGLVPEVELLGDWQRVRNLTREIPLAVREGSILGKKSAARQLRRVVRRNIRENGARIGWKPLSSTYKKKKSRRGFPANRIYYASGSYYRAIQIWDQGNNTFVGIRKRKYSKSSKSRLTLGQIARVLETGSIIRNIPARPLWGPSFRQFGGNKRIKGFMIWHIRNQIYLKTGVKAKISL